MKLFILEDYHDCKKLYYNTFLTKVSNGLYGTANVGSFPLPTITKADFVLLVTTYRDANNEYEAGGIDEKPAYEAALAAMTAGLDTMKTYVEGLPDLTVALINLSGYTPNKQSLSSSTIPIRPVLNELVHLGGGSVTVEFMSQDNVDFYGVYVFEGNGWPIGTTFINGVLDFPKGADVRFLHFASKQRLKTINNLTIGQQYTALAYAGNAAGVSPISIGITFTATNA